MIADVYTRLSRDREDQTSTRRQAKDCRRLAEAKARLDAGLPPELSSELAGRLARLLGNGDGRPVGRPSDGAREGRDLAA